MVEKTEAQVQRRTNLVRILALVAAVGITVFIVSIRDQVASLGVYGYPGIFLLSIVMNATIIIPVPGVLFTSAMAAVFNPFWVAVAAGSGAAVGETTAYLAGFSGQAVIENFPHYQSITGWMRKYGDLTIFLLALIPNPLADLAGITAGGLKVPYYRFIFWCWLGKIGKMLLFAYVGNSIFGLFGP